MIILKIVNPKYEETMTTAFKAAGFKVWGRMYSFSDGLTYRVELAAKPGTTREDEHTAFKKVLSSTKARIRAESEAKRNGGNNYGR